MLIGANIHFLSLYSGGLFSSCFFLLEADLEQIIQDS